MHALDALTFVTDGPVAEAGDLPVTAAERTALGGRLRSGAVVSAFYRGNVSRVENFPWEINGTDGDWC